MANVDAASAALGPTPTYSAIRAALRNLVTNPMNSS
jgi:hypothetical protein